MIRAPEHELRRAGIEQQPDVVLADAGYWHQVQMERLLGDGRTVLIPPDAKKRAGARPGWDGGLYSFMRRVLDTDAGGALYAKRQTMIEPVFATPSSTAASTASYAAAGPPPRLNGASARRPRTCSSSCGTPPSRRRPDRARRPADRTTPPDLDHQRFRGSASSEISATASMETSSRRMRTCRLCGRRSQHLP
jgi:hypothetical protein